MSAKNVINTNYKNNTPAVVYTKTIEGLGDISLRPMHVASDIKTIHEWVTQPYAAFWGMEKNTLEEATTIYNDLLALPYHDAFIGILDGAPIFLMERYEASKDIIGSYYNALANDIGMHILVGPPTKRIPSFTWNIFTTVMEFLFSDPATNRVVVEPDSNNKKIHVLNKRAGFKYQKEIQLPHKKAHLAFCERIDFEKAIKTNAATI
ncbi:GNAT family N-acetyltransferase [Aquimarina hainanensis]|uniref:GNAT family N-acetyltransferase n=1 Tax=Aquimarina hainanensis TaxID=1578017 RepID=A0ABW5N9R6_9FLAO|nr:GNAT family N-acetyltransferase [Aquimarina sp. TRL1]